MTTAADTEFDTMAWYHTLQMTASDRALDEALFELRRAQNNWPQDVPRCVSDLVECVREYRFHVNQLLKEDEND
jgi:hypothetical protein